VNPCLLRTLRRIFRMSNCLFLATLCFLLLAWHSALTDLSMAQESKGQAALLFCTHGGIAWQPVPRPSGFESEFAVAVVEIESPRSASNVAVSGFALFDEAGHETKAKRIIKVEEFDETRIPTDGVFAYYLNPGRSPNTRTWNGTLPAGKIRLRVRVVLESGPGAPVICKVTVGHYVIEGPEQGEWPT
jgi:hypothetical protein